MTEPADVKSEMTGRCLCGTVSFTATDVETGHHACHCKMCQHWSSGIYLAAPVGAVRFEGERNITRYASSEWAERGFCARCGSNLFYRLKHDGRHYVSVGTFDDQRPFTVSGEIYIDAKPAGYALAGDHPRLTEAELLAQLGIT